MNEFMKKTVSVLTVHQDTTVRREQSVHVLLTLANVAKIIVSVDIKSVG